MLDRTYYRLGSTTLKELLNVSVKELGVTSDLRKLPLEAVWMALVRRWWQEELKGFEDLDPAHIWLRSLNRFEKTYFNQLGQLKLKELGEIRLPVWELYDMEHMQLKDVLRLRDGLELKMTFEELWSKENDVSPLTSLLQKSSLHLNQAEPIEEGQTDSESEHRQKRDRSIVLIRTGLVPGVILGAVLLDRLTGPKQQTSTPVKPKGLSTQSSTGS